MKKRSEILQALIRIDREIQSLEEVLISIDPLKDVHIDISSNYENERPTFFDVSQHHFKTMIRNQVIDLQYRFNQLYNQLEDYTS